MSATPDGYEVVGRIIADLRGGPHDGECIILAPNGSIEIPGQLVYNGLHGDEPGWHLYEYNGMSVGQFWPKEDTAIPYGYVGFRKLGTKFDYSP